MGQAINLSQQLVLKNQFAVPSNKELTAEQCCALMKAAIPHFYDLIIGFQDSLQNATAQAEKVVEAKKQPVVEQPKLVLD